MLEKRHLEAILRINGMNANSTVDEIREVLKSARYNDDEINSAIAVLKETTPAGKVVSDGLHKVLRSNESLKPSEISELLAIDVPIDRLRPGGMSRATDLNEPIVFAFTTVVITTVGLLVAMYAYDIDILHVAEKAFGKI